MVFPDRKLFHIFTFHAFCFYRWTRSYYLSNFYDFNSSKFDVQCHIFWYTQITSGLNSGINQKPVGSSFPKISASSPLSGKTITWLVKTASKTRQPHIVYFPSALNITIFLLLTSFLTSAGIRVMLAGLLGKLSGEEQSFFSLNPRWVFVSPSPCPPPLGGVDDLM